MLRLRKHKWSDISLFKFQQIEEISSRELSEMDKLLFSVCVVFGMTEYQLDNTPVRKANRLFQRTTKIFSSPFNPVACKKIGKYRLTYDPSKLTFGQYIELCFFLNKPIAKSAHYILASMASADAERHRERAEYFFKQPIEKVIGSVQSFVKDLNAFNSEFKGLFGVDEEVSGNVDNDPFMKNYGWLYSATQVAEYERITLEAAFKLPVRRALNNLSFLKAKARFEAEQLKQWQKKK